MYCLCVQSMQISGRDKFMLRKVSAPEASVLSEQRINCRSPPRLLYTELAGEL